MKQNPIYIKVKNYSLANLSYDDFEAMSTTEMLTAAGTDVKVSKTFAVNMKRAVLMAIQARDDENKLAMLKAEAKGFLDTNFPNWEAEKGREFGKPCIKIWLEGAP